jgi:hypothetical protein
VKSKSYLLVAAASTLVVVVALVIACNTAYYRNGFWFLVIGVGTEAVIGCLWKSREVRADERRQARQLSRQRDIQRMKQRRQGTPYSRPGALHRRKPHLFHAPILAEPSEFRSH